MFEYYGKDAIKYTHWLNWFRITQYNIFLKSIKCRLVNQNINLQKA